MSDCSAVTLMKTCAQGLFHIIIDTFGRMIVWPRIASCTNYCGCAGNTPTRATCFRCVDSPVGPVRALTMRSTLFHPPCSPVQTGVVLVALRSRSRFQPISHSPRPLPGHGIHARHMTSVCMCMGCDVYNMVQFFAKFVANQLTGTKQDVNDEASQGLYYLNDSKGQNHIRTKI